MQSMKLSHTEAVEKLEAAKKLADAEAAEERASKERMLAALASGELHGPGTGTRTPGTPQGAPCAAPLRSAGIWAGALCCQLCDAQACGTCRETSGVGMEGWRRMRPLPGRR